MSTTCTKDRSNGEGQIKGQSSTEEGAAGTRGKGGRMGVASTCSTKRRLIEEKGGSDRGGGDGGNSSSDEMDTMIIDESPLAKIPKRDPFPTNNATSQLEDSVNLIEASSSSDFLATSILARTLLTNMPMSTAKMINTNNTRAITINNTSNITSASTTNNSTHLSSFPLKSNVTSSSLIESSSSSSTAKLESMVQQLEQAQQPIRPVTPFTLLPPLLDSIEELRSLSSDTNHHHGSSSSLSDPEFDSFLSNGKSCSVNGSSSSNSSNTRMTILSPIDAVVSDLVEDDDEEWTLLNSVTKFKTSSSTTDITKTSSTSSSSPGSVASFKSFSRISTCQNEITEDENGKSYFNLGASSDVMTTVARKNSSNSWTVNGNTKTDNGDDASSTSSSCDSISSEDLFNSCEDFDPSDDDDDDDDEDEEDERNYKQMRSNILHLSLCKLNMFRTQQCVEPSLHRSVLICNTLRHIEQEIRTEDEIRQDEAFLKSRERLPSFWPRSNHVNHQQQNGNGNPPGNRMHPQHSCTNSSPPRPQPLPLPPSSSSIPSSSPLQNLMTNNEPPYLSPNPYSNSSNNESSSPTLGTTPSPLFSNYDYSLIRPNQTPFHSISYEEYSSPLEQGHLSPVMIPNATNSTLGTGSTMLSELGPMSPAPSTTSLFECDSGYGEDLDMSSYYFGTSIAAPTPTASITAAANPNSYQQYPSSNCSTSDVPTSTPSTCSIPSYYTNGSISIDSSCTSDNMSVSSSASSNNVDSCDSRTSSGNCSPSTSPPSTSQQIPTQSDITSSNINAPNNNSTACPNQSSATSSRILLTNCHPSSSVEIELCSTHIIRNEYSHNPSTNSNNGIATTTTIWSAASNSPKTSCSSLCSSPTPQIALTSPAPSSTNVSCSMANLQQQQQQQQSFAQHESHQQQQCGMESRLSDFNLHSHMNGHHHHPHIGHSPHHQHLLPMDSLISTSYSSDS